MGKKIAFIGSSGGNLYKQGGNDLPAMMKELCGQTKAADMEIVFVQYVLASGSLDNVGPDSPATLFTWNGKEVQPVFQGTLCEVDAEAAKVDAQLAKVLTGIHLSSYGVDFKEEERESLLSLIQAVHEVEGIQRIRLGSLEPRIITEEFVGRLKKLHKVCPHFHLSLQSGCEETLKRMNRHYTPEEYYEKCKLLRAAFENPAITTDVIVGFPGETDEEFDKTRQFLEKVHFYEMHIFRYSRRKGTRADKMENQIPEETKAQRSGILSSLESQMTKEFRTKWTGACVKVLLEERQEINGVSYMVGHTPEYIKCAVETDAQDNTIIDAIIEGELTADVMKARQG